MPWRTAEEMGLSPEQIDAKVEELWRQDQEHVRPTCSDCWATIGEKHDPRCDVARCTKCRGQRLSCQCTDGDSDTWDGMWPRTRECYEKKLIAYEDTVIHAWSFDYNRLPIGEEQSMERTANGRCGVVIHSMMNK